MNGRKQFTSIDEVRLDIFLKRYKLSKNEKVLKGNIRWLLTPMVSSVTEENFANNICL